MIELEALVKEWIKKGYRPQGGLCFAHGSFYQAMVQVN